MVFVYGMVQLVWQCRIERSCSMQLGSLAIELVHLIIGHRPSLCLSHATQQRVFSNYYNFVMNSTTVCLHALQTISPTGTYGRYIIPAHQNAGKTNCSLLTKKIIPSAQALNYGVSLLFSIIKKKCDRFFWECRGLLHEDYAAANFNSSWSSRFRTWRSFGQDSGIPPGKSNSKSFPCSR